MKKLETQADFEEVMSLCDTVPVVQLEDRRMGMCNHVVEEGVLVDAYRDNDHQCILIPFRNFFHLGGGALYAGLKGATVRES